MTKTTRTFLPVMVSQYKNRGGGVGVIVTSVAGKPPAAQLQGTHWGLSITCGQATVAAYSTVFRSVSFT